MRVTMPRMGRGRQAGIRQTRRNSGCTQATGAVTVAAAGRLFSSDHVERIALELSDERRVFRNGDGRKSFCPLCQSENRRHRPRPTLSIAVRDGKILLYCHRCETEGTAIIRELVRRGLLPDLFRDASASLALLKKVRAAMEADVWTGTAKATDRLVLNALIGISGRCYKEDFGASVREVALLARLHESTASRSLHRLKNCGWVQKTKPALGEKAAVWRLQEPRRATDQRATNILAEKEGDRLFHADPFFSRGDRAGLPRLVAPFVHDVFRWRTGLGAIRGQIYALLSVPLRAREIASALGFKHTRNVRIHLKTLANHGLVRRGFDCRYERGDAQPDAVAAQLGVLGACEKQAARYKRDRDRFRRLERACEHWKKTGEVVDPETGEVLGVDAKPSTRAGRAVFRRRVLQHQVANESIVDKASLDCGRPA